MLVRNGFHLSLEPGILDGECVEIKDVDAWWLGGSQQWDGLLALNTQRPVRRPRILDVRRQSLLILLKDNAARELGVLDAKSFERRADVGQFRLEVARLLVIGESRAGAISGFGQPLRKRAAGSRSSILRGRLGPVPGFRQMLNHRDRAFD